MLFFINTIFYQHLLSQEGINKHGNEYNQD
jgi:hypothetical protein